MINDTVLVEVALIKLNIPPIVKLCKFDSIVLNQGGGSQYTYRWSPPSGLSDTTAYSPVAKPTVTTTYNVHITQLSTLGTLCSITKQIVVGVSSDTLGTNIGNDTIVCKGSYINLRARSFGKANTFYWSHYNTFTDTLNININDSVLKVFPNGSHSKYYVKASNGYCINVDSINIQTDSVNISTISSAVCLSNTTTLSVTNNSNKPLSYLWSPLIHIIGSFNTNIITVKPVATTTYYVRAIDANNCSTISNAVVTVHSPPTLTAIADKYTLYQEENTQLHAVPSDFNYSYQWQPSNLLTDQTIANPYTATTVTTLYSVTVTDNSNALQCISIDTVLVTYKERNDCGEPKIFIPNAFTPDGNGRNDILYVRGDNISELEFIIYNRWGEKMVEIHNLSQGWDGTYNGSVVEPGVFVYYLRVKCIDGESYFKKGNVTLIR
jgi:gliding motility-associated-like protein